MVRKINARIVAIESNKIVKAQVDNTLDTQKSIALTESNVAKRLQRSQR